MKSELFAVLQPTASLGKTGDRIFQHIETYPAERYAEEAKDKRGGEQHQQGATVYFEIHNDLGSPRYGKV